MTLEIDVQDRLLKSLLEAGVKIYAPALAGSSLRLTDKPQSIQVGESSLLLISDISAFSIPSHIPAQNVFTAPFRLGALLERAAILDIADQARWKRGAVLNIGPFLLYPDDSRLVDAARDLTIRLTEKERDILVKLHDKAGAVIGREDLLRDVWGYAPGLETHTLETHIYRLRQKIEIDPAAPLFLLTEENGYRLAL